MISWDSFHPSLFSDFNIYWAHPSCLNYLYLHSILLGKMALTRTVSDANTAIWLIFCWRPEKNLWTHCPWTHYQTHRSWSALYSGKLPRFAQMVSKYTMENKPMRISHTSEVIPRLTVQTANGIATLASSCSSMMEIQLLILEVGSPAGKCVHRDIQFH